MNDTAPFPDKYPDDDAMAEIIHCNIESEQAVLGALLMNNERLWDVEGWLREEHFYELLHGRIYTAIGEMVRKGSTANGVTLKSRFEGDPAIEEMGGTGYFANLLTASVTANPVPYARDVVQLAQRRRLSLASMNIREMADDRGLDPEEMVSLAEAELADVADDSRSQVNIRSMSQLVDDALKAATEAAKQEGGVIGVSTGLTRLDNVLGGFRPGNFIVLGGRPGMGKSALGLLFGLNAARASVETDAGYGVAFLSLEMEGEELTFRAFSAGATRHNIWHPYSEIARGIYNGGQMDAIGLASRELSELPLYVEDTGRKTVSSIRGVARTIDRLFKKQGRRLGLLIIDHMGIAYPDKAYEGYKVAEMTQISNDLKSTAKQLQIPVVALHQLSRAVEARDNKRPVLSDLRDSGSIEQDADVVLFAYREAYYKKKAEPDFNHPDHADWRYEFEEVEHDLDVIIAKNRHGPEASLKFHCDIGCNVVLDRKPLLGQQGSFEIGSE